MQPKVAKVPGRSLQQAIRQLPHKHRKAAVIMPTFNLQQQLNQQFNLAPNQPKMLTKVLGHNIEQNIIGRRDATGAVELIDQFVFVS